MSSRYTTAAVVGVGATAAIGTAVEGYAATATTPTRTTTPPRTIMDTGQRLAFPSVVAGTSMVAVAITAVEDTSTEGAAVVMAAGRSRP